MESVSIIEINRIINKIFDNSKRLLEVIAPNGWRNSVYVHFCHPTPEQQYRENIDQIKNINKIAKNHISVEDFNPDKYILDDLTNISEDQEFQYVLGLSVYDIFSNNHEVYSNDNEVYNLGSFRGSGTFIANFLNSKNSGNKTYDYLDFYMGTIWIENRSDLLPFYEYIFQILKNEGCDWEYCFPRLYLLDLNSNDNIDVEDSVNYKPEESLTKEIEILNNEKENEEFQHELDLAFEEDFENAKYQPLIPVVQAYKNIYKRLPQNHPQKEFE